MDSRSVAIPPLSERTALPTAQRRYLPAIALITMPDLADHDRPIPVITMLPI
jgi:hypothetical protein